MTPEQLPFDGGKTPDIDDRDMRTECELELEAATDTIAVLRHALRNIRMTAEKANATDWKHATDWIEGEAGRVLKAIVEVTE